MIFNKIAKAFQKTEDMTDTLIYHMAEQIIRDALKRSCQSITIKCCPKEKPDIVDTFTIEEEQDSPMKRRHGDGGDYELGFFTRKDGEVLPFMTAPAMYFLPLLNILSSEKTEYKGKKCFALYEESSSQKRIDRYIDVTLYLERDSSISFDIEEIV